MTWVTVENTQVPVDTDDIQWKLRYSTGSLTTSDFLVAAGILGVYHHLTDPFTDEEDAVSTLIRARTGTAQVRDQERQKLYAAVAHEWVLDCQPPKGESYLLGPYTRIKAEEMAKDENRRNPDLHITLRKTMP